MNNLWCDDMKESILWIFLIAFGITAVLVFIFTIFIL